MKNVLYDPTKVSNFISDFHFNFPDDEARERVPEPFIVQKNDRANPPTLFLALDTLIDEGHIKDAQLEALYPRLVAWFNWFNSTQLGPIPSTYAWQGRHIGDQNLELNPKTLTSGLDDFPRASHPTKAEYHLDLRCWMALAAQGTIFDTFEHTCRTESVLNPWLA